MKRLSLVSLLLLTLAFTACGGGGSGSGSSGGSGSTTPNVISITTNAILPVTLEGLPYSVTLTAANAQAPLKWSIQAQSPFIFPDVAIDATTGVISGTPTHGGVFMAFVTDATSKTATKQFTLDCWPKLRGATPSNYAASQFQLFSRNTSITGGMPPLTYTVSSGSLPPGLKINNNGNIAGTPLKAGSYSAIVSARDSWSTQQTADQQIDVTVSGVGVSLSDNFQQKQVINQPIAGKLYAGGGVPPYTYTLKSGQLPQGVTLDPSTGQLLGTPTTTSSASLQFEAKDSTDATAGHFSSFQVVAGSGRNDTVQTATPIDNGTFVATLSPYIDPPNKAPTAADTDYYKISSIAGTVINISAAVGGGPIDPVIEVLDGNAQRLATCNVPDNSSQTFTSACINDEDGKGGHDASLAYKVPGTAPNVVNSYIHVLDWRGDARPDMQYYLSVVGNITPIFNQFSLARGSSVNRTFFAPGSWGTTNWTLDSGALPDGLSLSNDGTMTGIPTTDGDYSFRLKAVDSSTPPQTFYLFETVKVIEPVKITSPAVWPNACVGKSYSFTITTSGGAAPYTYLRIDQTVFPLIWASYSPIFSANPTTAGTYPLKIRVFDTTGSNDTQDVTLTVQNCP